MGLLAAKCNSTVRLDGMTAVITGANSGIGKETAKDFYIRGCDVVAVCRDTEKAEEALEDIRRECKNQPCIGTLECLQMDLGSMASIRRCVERLRNKPKIQIVVNNAGVMACPFSRTVDGFEIQWGTNYLGHFLFTLLLMPKLIESRPVRIVNVASVAHVFGRIDFDDLNWEKRRYRTVKAYAQSKLSLILFTKELAKRLDDYGISGVNVYSLHPGVVSTDLGRHIGDSLWSGLACMWNRGGVFMKTPKQGAQTSIYCSVDEKVKTDTGMYYDNCKVKRPSRNARNMRDARRLWDESLKYVELENYDPFKC